MNDTKSDDWFRATWPLDRGSWARLGIAFVAVVAVFVAVGEVLTNWSALGGIVDLDRRVAEDVADGRTDVGNDLAPWAAGIADTPIKIGLSILICGFLIWRLRRWRETAMIAMSLIFEATAFIVTTTIVGRPRPEVERLLESPVNTSFPSGHVAAAAVYSAIAVVVFWNTRAVWARTLAVVFSVLAPIAVGWARIYQGMHYLSDVVAGVVLGVVSVVIVAKVLGPPTPEETSRDERGGHHGDADDVATGHVRTREAEVA